MNPLDQKHIFEAYKQVLLNEEINSSPKTSTITLEIDEKGWYKPHMSTYGEVLKNRFFARYDSEGNPLKDLKEPPLQEGQFLVKTTPYLEVYKVEKTSEGFQGVLTKDYPSNIESDLEQRNKESWEKTSKHFFPK